MDARCAAALTANAATGSSLRVLAFVSLVWTLFAGAAWANDVSLILVAGDVRLQRSAAGQSARTLVPVNGTQVLPGDVLVTGATGRLQLRFSDGSLVSLQPQSEFRIDDYRFDLERQRGFFSLVRGALRTISGAVGKRDPADYRLTTPTATIGIRGTEFLVEETVCNPGCYPGRTPGLRVAVSSGRVVVYNPAGSIEVPAGGATYVADRARPPVPTTERPTMSTAPASVDPAGPRSATRVAGRAPVAVDRVAGASSGEPPTAAATVARASKEAGAAADPVKVRAGGDSAAEEDTGESARAGLPSMAEGVPPSLLAQWSGGTTGPATVSFERTTAPSPSAAGVGSPTGSPATHAVLAGLAPAGARSMTAPVGDATGTNAQRDAAGMPVALAAVDTSHAAGVPGGDGSGNGRTGAAGSIGGGSGSGTGANPSPGSGGSGNGADTGGIGRDNPPGGGNTGGGDSGGGNAGGDTGNGNGNGNGDTGSGNTGGGNGGDSGSGGNGGGDSGSGSTGGGDSGSGEAGGGTGGGAPDLAPGFNSVRRVAIQTLQSPYVDVRMASGAAFIGLDSQYRLESIGLCPRVYCFSRGTAEVVDAGYNSDVSWGRWTTGSARLTMLGYQNDFALGSNNGVHYLVGVPTASMPTSGSAYYAMSGATSPTFASGASAPGTFTGQGLVRFAAGQQTQVAFQGDMVFGSGERYHLFSNGAKTDSAGRLAEIGATQIHMTGRTTFHGSIGVVSQGSADRLGCAGGNCQAQVEGGFYGPQAARMGVGYTVGRTGSGGDTINGVAVLNRE